MTLLPFAVKHISELQSHRVRQVVAEALQVVECTQRKWGSSECSFVINALCKRYLPQVGNRWEMQLSYRNGNQAAPRHAHKSSASTFRNARTPSALRMPSCTCLFLAELWMCHFPAGPHRMESRQQLLSHPLMLSSVWDTPDTLTLLQHTDIAKLNCLADKPVPLSRPLSSCHLVFLFCSTASPLLRGKD